MHVFSFSLTLACRLMIVFSSNCSSIVVSAANQRDPSNSSVGSACLLLLSSRHSSLPLSHVFGSGIFFFVSEQQLKHFSGRHCTQSLNATSFSFAFFVCLWCGTFCTIQTLERKQRKIPSFKTLHVSPSHLVLVLLACECLCAWLCWAQCNCVSCMRRCLDLLRHAGDRRKEALPSVWRLVSTFSFKEECCFLKK